MGSIDKYEWREVYANAMSKNTKRNAKLKRSTL